MTCESPHFGDLDFPLSYSLIVVTLLPLFFGDRYKPLRKVMEPEHELFEKGHLNQFSISVRHSTSSFSGAYRIFPVSNNNMTGYHVTWSPRSTAHVLKVGVGKTYDITPIHVFAVPLVLHETTCWFLSCCNLWMLCFQVYANSFAGWPWISWESWHLKAFTWLFFSMEHSEFWEWLSIKKILCIFMLIKHD